MIQEIPDTMLKTIEISSNEVGSIAARLKGASHLYFTGCGTAFFSAMLGSRILSITAANSLEFECVQALELANQHPISPNGVGFGVSHSGITRTTLDALRAVKSKGGYTVGITHFANSPICKVADKALVV
jgi:glucosamine 6-phosphate synthetase-like amidotransferase/phosphosugar isomerase protein